MNGDGSDNGAPDFEALKKSVKNGIRKAVEATNRLLASLETTTDSVSKPLAKGVKKVEQEGSYLAGQVMRVYERRYEYGPHLVAGSALAVGGLMTLRRGKILGAASAALSGGLAYVAVYEPIPLQDMPDLIFGSKK
ncbi:predicted protein [Phaeodactylum tricornutum CCAP 1055/1]|jgi:hypothetical protein|uniref:MICOS complex subunit n=1 Tax=Phaeodactylum tricornutum (strain CCAP 1055/1) TaxID=556484 RepID=B5Y5V7_PHATC|nr:predicted protein [Phaeodactylum tricornutum CCAP 1055/1]ACI65725.1 predicted protein [Phaeodactylum tricornutum CCAP 1055/1]|eukprot:XP_002186255.1 predicted protein [Phaeodactylum tricornutum CCAP 1055/1]